MGFPNVKVELECLRESRGKHEVELLEDTGALYSMVPAGVLREAGVEPRLQIEFEIADGSRIRRNVGEARFHFNGSSAVSRVIFGNENDAGGLGVVALEELGLEVDPVNKQLRPARMILY